MAIMNETSICGEGALFLPGSECDDCERFVQDVERLDGEIEQLKTDAQALADGKQNRLVAGDNITLEPQPDGTVEISATGGGCEYCVPAGGSTGQVLTKDTSEDGDFSWRDAGLGGTILRIITVDSTLQDQEVHITDGYDTVTGIINGTRADISVGAMSGQLLVTAIDTEGYTAQAKVTVNGFGVYMVNLYVQRAYGFHYSENDSNSASVTYPPDTLNAEFTPFRMDLTSGVPNYDGWSPTNPDVAWLFPKSCMVKYDGTVDYYLDENDETKKADGTASDVANPNYGGNAMMEWGQYGKRIYWKIVPDADEKGFTFYVADKRVDSDFDAWNHYNSNGTLSEHFYTPKYVGGHDGTRLRSISGMANYVYTSGADQIAKAKANNPSGSPEMWNIENYCDRLLISMLLCMMGKSMNTQAVFGQGRCASGNTGAIANNTLNGRGLFCGFSDQISDVKVFGMQGWWGNLWRRTNGLINVGGDIRVKLAYGQQDGSTVDGYNTDGSGYISQGTIATNLRGNQISHMNITNRGITPNAGAGGGQTYYADAVWAFTTTSFMTAGGAWRFAEKAGAFCADLVSDFTHADPSIGAALSCRPLA